MELQGFHHFKFFGFKRRNGQLKKTEKLESEKPPTSVQRCQWCYRKIGSFQAAQEQHERFSENCLRWQFYLSGSTTWGRACARAKAVREERLADGHAAKSMRQRAAGNAKKRKLLC